MLKSVNAKPFTENNTGTLSPYIVWPAWGVMIVTFGVPETGVGEAVTWANAGVTDRIERVAVVAKNLVTCILLVTV